MGRKTVQNDITSPELLEQVNPKNKQLKKEFIRYMKSLNRSPQSLYGYENDIDIFFVFLLKECDNKFFIDCTIRDFVNFQGYLLEDNHNSPARIRRIKSALSSMSNSIELLYSDEYPQFRNLVRKVESPANTPSREKTVLSQDQIDGLLKNLVDNKKYEQACCLALATYSGRRKAELFRFKVSMFNDQSVVYNTLYKTEPIKSKGRNGGKYIPFFVFKKQFDPYLSLWLNERKENGIDSEWLFPEEGDNTSPRGCTVMNSWCSAWSKILGVDIYPHSLRHLFITNMRASGLPDQVIISIIGWDKAGGSNMLEIYDDSDITDSFGEYFNDGEIKAKSSKTLSEL